MVFKLPIVAVSWREGSHHSSQLDDEEDVKSASKLLLKKNIYIGFSTAVQRKLLGLLACGLAHCIIICIQLVDRFECLQLRPVQRCPFGRRRHLLYKM